MFGLSTPRDDEFTEFVRSATPSLSWTAYLLTGDREAARDLLQEALVKTYLAWGRVRHHEAAGARDPELESAHPSMSWTALQLADRSLILVAGKTAEQTDLVKSITFTDARGERVTQDLS